MALRESTSGICGLLAVMFGVTLAAAGELKPFAERLPSTTAFYIEVPNPPAVLSTVFDHPLRAKLEALNVWQAALQKKEYLAFTGAREYVELQLGMGWREAVERLTSGGIALAFDPQTEGIALVIRSRDEASLTQIIDVLMRLARADAKSKGQPDPYQTHDYNGQVVYQTKDAYFTQLGAELLIVNKDRLGKQLLESWHSDDTEDALAKQPRFTAARETQTKSAAVWAWIDVDWARTAADQQGKPFQKQTDNPVAELLVGGLLDTFQHTPWLTAAFELSMAEAAFRFRTPHQSDWVTESRVYFFGPDGHGAAPAAPAVDGLLFSLGSYRNLSDMWLRAGDLFPENVVDKLAEADSNLTIFFSGKDFGEDILGALAPTLQFVAVQQEFPEDRPTPSIKLPGFAFLFDMRDATTATRELKRTFTSFVGFANVTGAMEGNPQLELDMPKTDGFELVTARFLPRAGEEHSREATLQFNFSPSVAFAGSRFILSSSEGLARQLAAAETTTTAPANTTMQLHVPVLQQVLRANESHLIAKNMLEEGHSREEAQQQIDLFLRALGVLRDASIELTTDNGHIGLDLKLRLKEQR